MNKNTLKFIRSLHLKKFRREEGMFLVEGEKSIIELLHSDFDIVNIFVTREIFEKYREDFRKFDAVSEIVEEEDLTKASTLEFNDTGIAVVRVKENAELSIENEIVVMLDEIQSRNGIGAGEGKQVSGTREASRLKTRHAPHREVMPLPSHK